MDDASFDAVVVGAGPNGLAAAVTLARRGLRVRVYEAAATIGGGCRTGELTLPGFAHDVCSAVHPLAVASPFLREFDLGAHGVRLLHPDVAFAHPLDGGRAAVTVRSVDETADRLGGADARAYRRLYGPLVDTADEIVSTFLAPLRSTPAHPLAVARFGLSAVRSAASLVESRFGGDPARAMFSGAAAHAMMPLERRPTAAFGLLLSLLAHAVGWPVVEGGSQALVDALASEVVALGGDVVTSCPVRSLDELPRARAVLLDVTPIQLFRIVGERFPARFRRALVRYRYGPGVFKVDYALSEPAPWANDDCRSAGTVHVGGTFDEIAASERHTNEGRHPDHPYVLVVQPTVTDRTRAPAGRHTLWAYCHVPSGSTVDMTAAIEQQVERFAPGFGDVVLARATRTAADYESYDANYVGGDINAGVQDIAQTVFRPTRRWSPYATPLRGVYLCSSSTPPGGGVHGMCGYFAAVAALRREFGLEPPSVRRRTADAVATAELSP
jgi:phytoene dehydrogenase-like protein